MPVERKNDAGNNFFDLRTCESVEEAIETLARKQGFLFSGLVSGWYHNKSFGDQFAAYAMVSPEVLPMLADANIIAKQLTERFGPYKEEANLPEQHLFAPVGGIIGLRSARSLRRQLDPKLIRVCGIPTEEEEQERLIISGIPATKLGEVEEYIIRGGLGVIQDPNYPIEDCDQTALLYTPLRKGWRSFREAGLLGPRGLSVPARPAEIKDLRKIDITTPIHLVDPSIK